MSKIKKSIYEYLEEIEGCCEQLGIKYNYEKKNDKEHHILINDTDLIRVYDTKKGINPDLSVTRDKELAEKILETWNEKFFKEVTNNTFSYKEIKNITKDLDILNEFADDNNCIVKDKEIKNNNVVCCKVIEDMNIHEKITVQLFKTNTLMLQGSKGVLWEKLCQQIEKKERRVSAKDILYRISGDTNDYTNEHCEDNLESLLGKEVYEFLSIEDRQYLLCANQLIIEEKQFLVYTPILCSAALALEGYFKTLLIKLKVSTILEISESNFNFGSIFNNGKMISSRKKKIDVNDSNGEDIVKELEKIYRKIKAFRNPVCHSGAGVSMNTLIVKSFARCKELYLNEYINTIKESYDKIYK